MPAEDRAPICFRCREPLPVGVAVCYRCSRYLARVAPVPRPSGRLESLLPGGDELPF